MSKLKFLVFFCSPLVCFDSYAQTAISDNIFSESRKEELCTVDAGVELQVGRPALAIAILDEAKLSRILLKGKTRKGNEARALDIMRDRSLLENADLTAEQIEPFDKTFDSISLWLQARGAGNSHYKVRSEIQGSIKPKHFFGREANKAKNQTALAPVVTIACTDSPVQARQDVGDSIGATLQSLMEDFVVRGDVKGLSVAKGDLSAASPAEISFTDNIEKKEETFQADVVLGRPFNFDFETFPTSVIPFLEYHNKKTTTRDAPASKVETIGPGVLVNTFVDTDPIAWEFSGSAQYVFDEAQGNDIVRGETFFDPSFEISDRVFIGKYSKLENGVLEIRPDLSAVALAGHVADDGTSPILEKDDDFYGVGGQASLNVFFPNLPTIKNLTLGVSYRYVELFSLPIDNAAKWEATAEYSLDQSGNFTVRFVYEDGRNATTFQDEEFWKVAFGVRF